MKTVAMSHLTICGIDELPTHRSSAVSHVLSILDPDRIDPDIFSSYAPHERTVLRFYDVINAKEGRPIPSKADVSEILKLGDHLKNTAIDRRNGHLLVHCHMGVSRSTAALVTLMAQADPGRDIDQLFASLREIRPIAWPNSVMIGHADDLLGLDGALVAGLHRHYAIQLERDPVFDQWMTGLDRAREVAIARDLLAANPRKTH
ncbi:protein-tyrosine-phosphatase [Thalassospira sp. MA62]|nr:protein-tyrosine-phosphatase [Thalassospira sp. MA62]